MTAVGFRRMITRLGKAAKMPFSAHPHMLCHARGFRLANDGPRHAGATALPRAQEHPAHGALHRAFARPLPGLLEGLIARSRLDGPRKRLAVIRVTGRYRDPMIGQHFHQSSLQLVCPHVLELARSTDFLAVEDRTGETSLVIS